VRLNGKEIKKRHAEFILRNYGDRRMYIGVSLVGDKKIAALNKKYLKRDCPTDVLSFNYSEGDYLGDVVVSVDRAKVQARQAGQSYETEVAELVKHGILHLLGVHHDGD